MNHLYEPSIHNLLSQHEICYESYLVTVQQSQILLSQITTDTFHYGIIERLGKCVHTIRGSVSELRIPNHNVYHSCKINKKKAHMPHLLKKKINS